MIRKLTSCLVLVALIGCGGGGSSGGGFSTTVAPVNSQALPSPTGTAPATTQSATAAPVSASLALNEFTVFREQASIADLRIPGGALLARKAFVLEDKGFVRVLDLSGAKPVLDRVIALDAAAPFALGTAAGTLSIVDDHTAVVTASGNEAVYIFDPSSAQTAADVTKIDLSTMQATFNTTPINSKGQPAPNPMPLTYTASATIAAGKLFIASSNLDANFDLNPGTVVAFDYDPVKHTLSNGSLMQTSCFNPNRLVHWRSAAGEAILCVNAGVSGSGPSSVDVIDPAKATITASLPLGAVNAFGDIAITPDGKRGYVGSESAAELYELDLSGLPASMSLVGTIKLPGSAGLDYVAGVAVSSSGKYVYATNLNTSSLAIVDVATRSVVGTLAGFQRNGDPTKFQCNASVIAVRPGVPGVDFTGPAAFVGTIALDAGDQTIPSVTSALDGVSFDRN